MQKPAYVDYDYIIIGSGFGGSVSALRLAEKGYRVLVLEKGQWKTAADFPRTNWNLKRWLWLPLLRFFGFFRISFFQHLGVLSGVGVGGGSLVYANTLVMPEDRFFEAETWRNLADWKGELAPHYRTALRMLGADRNPRLQVGDLALQRMAADMGREDQFDPTTVAVYFGEPEQEVDDPYFGGKGPRRAGCRFCGGCMIGCRYNAKNTLDKNYLYLAQQAGATIQAESEVFGVQPLRDPEGKDGYKVRWKSSTSWWPKRGEFTCRGVVFAGGVLGTVRLLLQLKETSLPRLSPTVGAGIRTNSESLIGVTTFDKDTRFSEGIAIGSALQTDEFSQLQPVRYSAGSGFWRLLMAPLVHGSSFFARMKNALVELVWHPWEYLRMYLVRDWASRTQILLYMRTLEGALRFRRGRFGMRSALEPGQTPPTPFIPEAKELAEKYAGYVNGKPGVLATETLLGIPTTAHILGGAVMGDSPATGVIDSRNRVFGYRNLYVCDGSMIPANPGVNPSLTITALTERAMSKIPDHEAL